MHIDSRHTHLTSSVMATSGESSTVRSDVWKWFKKVSDSTKVECILCSKTVAYRGGTTNLRNHLVYKHPLIYKPKAQSKGEEGSSKQGTLDAVVKSHYCSEAKAKVITDKILMMIALEGSGRTRF